MHKIVSEIKSRKSSQISNQTDKNEKTEQPLPPVKTEVPGTTSQNWGGGPSGSNKSLDASNTVIPVRKSSRLLAAEINAKPSSG